MNVQVIRGDEWLDDMRIHARIEGTPVNYQRRRYGNTTFTWVEAWFEGKGWVSLGDPWPCVTPKRADVVQAIQRARGEG